MKHRTERSLPRASMRAPSSYAIHEPEPDFEMESEMPHDELGALFESFDASEMSEMSESPSWQDLYTDDRLRISYQGEVSREKREQVELAAELIKKILLSNG
jgi:hypothetical protein